MNNQRRSFKNISELVVCDVKEEILSTAARYVNLIREYQNASKLFLPGDVLNGQAKLNEIDNIFNYYYEHITDYYGEKSQLCTLHLHSHLKDQVLKHGALVFTSCFARESYLGHSLKWCLGKKYILEQFITWYNVDRTLASSSSLNLDDIFNIEKFDKTYMDKSCIQNYQQKLIICSDKKNIDLTKPIFYSRYSRGLKMFHSRAYTRSGNSISYLVSVLTETCPMNQKTCLGEVLFYFNVSDMNTSSISHNRVRRSTAGINKRYDEQDYVLVSFPQLNKHSVVPAASVNVDPLDEQTGSIKTFGSRKNLRIISSGSKEMMKERASRYVTSAGSEEVGLVPDEQSQMEIISSNVNDQTTTFNYECAESHLWQKIPPSDHQLSFNRVYSSKTGTKKMYEDNHDESSLSGSDLSDGECTEESCSGCKKHEEQIAQLRKRLDRMEKVIPVIKKCRSKTPITLTNQSNPTENVNDVYLNIKEVTGVNPNQIKGTPTRPTIIMRQLIKQSDHINDKSFLKEHENLFKEFDEIIVG
ncbi:unnamed protein product [Rotaria sordida]|uniref:Uncharacterized protein n=1 Tax=Rotaria sordida TaxID=392033 RepID=A0A814VEG1_9BILA|nr:unnamed protein product [Rotaria sordida]